MEFNKHHLKPWTNFKNNWTTIQPMGESKLYHDIFLKFLLWPIQFKGLKWPHGDKRSE